MRREAGRSPRVLLDRTVVSVYGVLKDFLIVNGVSAPSHAMTDVLQLAAKSYEGGYDPVHCRTMALLQRPLNIAADSHVRGRAPYDFHDWMVPTSVDGFLPTKIELSWKLL